MRPVTAFIVTFMIISYMVFVIVVSNADAHPMKRAQASYYTLYGNRTACGVTMSDRAWHVAALTREHARCGRRIILCNGRKCVGVRVMDRGAYRSDGRMWDLTPRVKRALRCGDLCNVRWHHGWSHR